jgi:diguanylate cyclase (GGDEF)-like protein
LPSLGALVALGAPLGLAALRALVGASDALVWGYFTVYATAAFVLLGYRLGRAEDRLRESCFTDALTGIANRRRFDQRLAEEVARAARTGADLALLMLDLDGLKAINDAHGHGAGDRAIRRVATCLAATCRSAADLAARLGGDEFAVLAPYTSALEGRALAERIRKNLSGSEELVTVSIGVAELSRGDLIDGAQLYADADRALYRAKAFGRDRCAVAGHGRTAALRPSKRKETPDGPRSNSRAG